MATWEDYKDAPFDVRTVSVIKVNKILDLKIVIEECDYALSQIKNQLATPGFGDEEWRVSALAARSDFEHRKRMAALKIEGLEEERRTTHQTSPEMAFAKRFMEAAKEILPGDIYNAVFAAAGAKNPTRQAA